MKAFRCAMVLSLILAVMGMGTAASHATAAAGFTVQISQEADAVANQPVVLDATVVDAAGAPVPGVVVTFYVKDTFGRVTGDVEIGRDATSSAGVASITYRPREAGPRDVRVEAAAKDGTTAKAATTITVAGAAEQAYKQTAGIKVPGLNVWLIIALLTIVWGTLLFVGLTVVRIAAAGSDEASNEVTGARGGG
jgi:hypothetical protein